MLDTRIVLFKVKLGDISGVVLWCFGVGVVVCGFVLISNITHRVQYVWNFCTVNVILVGWFYTALVS